eukprot:SAG25_NODE_5780_length_621_cov_1.392720_1_plen_94_part_10
MQADRQTAAQHHARTKALRCGSTEDKLSSVLMNALVWMPIVVMVVMVVMHLPRLPRVGSIVPSRTSLAPARGWNTIQAALSSPCGCRYIAPTCV